MSRAPRPRPAVLCRALRAPSRQRANPPFTVNGASSGVQEPQVLVLGSHHHTEQRAPASGRPPMGKEREGDRSGRTKSITKRHKRPSSTWSSTATLAARQGGISTIMLGHLPFHNPSRVPERTITTWRLLSLAVKRGGCGALGHLCSSGRHSDLLFSQDMQPSATSQRHLDHARTTRASHVTNARTWRNPV